MTLIVNVQLITVHALDNQGLGPLLIAVKQFTFGNNVIIFLPAEVFNRLFRQLFAFGVDRWTVFVAYDGFLIIDPVHPHGRRRRKLSRQDFFYDGASAKVGKKIGHED